MTTDANRNEVRGLTEDLTDLQGNVYRLDVLSMFEAMDERFGEDGAAERAEMRTALAAASDDQGNVLRSALDVEWAKVIGDQPAAVSEPISSPDPLMEAAEWLTAILESHDEAHHILFVGRQKALSQIRAVVRHVFPTAAAIHFVNSAGTKGHAILKDVISTDGATLWPNGTAGIGRGVEAAVDLINDLADVLGNPKEYLDRKPESEDAMLEAPHGVWIGPAPYVLSIPA